MEPIIKIIQPFSYISVIKIYAPRIKNVDIISFLIKIDDCFISIDLLGDGVWKDGTLRQKYPEEVLHLIIEEIQYKYL
jgi:hypothetical protein